MTKENAFAFIAITLIIGGICFALFSRPQTNSAAAVLTSEENQEATTGSEAKLLESAGPAEFDPANDVKAAMANEDKDVYKEFFDAIHLGGDLGDKGKIRQAVQAVD